MQRQQQQHDCHNCQCCADARAAATAAAEAAVRKERAAATQIRRRLEAETAALSKERKQFETYKTAELERVKAAATKASRQRHRDYLAEGARLRASTKENVSQEKLELEKLRVELERERQEASNVAGHYRNEMEKLKKQIARLEKENLDLKQTINGFLATKERKGYQEQTRSGNSGGGNGGGSNSSSNSNAASVLAPPPHTHDKPTTTRRNTKVEPQREDAHRTIKHPNGAVTHHLPSGDIVTTFSNGDVKQERVRDNRVEYMYREIGVWQVSHSPPSAVETFYFSDGRVETHFGNECGRWKEVAMPNGVALQMKIRNKDGVGGEEGEEEQVAVAVTELRPETLLPPPTELVVWIDTQIFD